MIMRHRLSGREIPFTTLFSILAISFALTSAPAAIAQCPATVPVEGAAPPGPLPLFPVDNWWNLDVSSAPIDTNSVSYISFINSGGTRKLHPDFGGEASPGSVDVYGFPYAIVDGSEPKQAVTFQYWDESDGVDYSTHQGVPFYPIPAQAITQPHWVEGGAQGNVDERSQGDRHLLIIDCADRYLYELYNVYYDTQGKWNAGSGAFFDMTRNDRRPEGWTSADAAGLAIFPGLVRYDEAWNTAVTDIGHAFRVTVRASNGHVYPASHTAGSTAGALPMGARLRLKTSVGGSDPASRTSDPNLQKIFRAMQKYGLIVADNGSDMYISGTFDTRWNNSILNPAFSLLTASDFEVIQLGWNPPSTTTAAVNSVSVAPNAVVGGQPSTGTVFLTSAAPAGGAVISLSSASSAASVPGTIIVYQGASSANFTVTTSTVTMPISATLSATYNGGTKSTILAVNPVSSPATALATLTLNPKSVVGGSSLTGTVTLTAPAPVGGAVVRLATSDSLLVSVPASVVIAAGTTSSTFTATTARTRRKRSPTISAVYDGVTKTASLTVTVR